MNDIDFHAPVAPDNVLQPTSASTVNVFATVTAGTGTPPSLATLLAAIGDDPADFIVSPFGDSTSLSAVTSAFGDVSGRWSWARMTYGAYWFPMSGTFSWLITAGLANPNARQIVPVGRYAASPTPSWIWIAERAALEAPWLSDIDLGNVSRNQTGRQTLESRPPRDRSLLWNYNARNQLNMAGVSSCGVSPDGHITIDKTVTGYRVNSANQPDTVFRDVQSIYQIGLGLPYIRFRLYQEQGNKALMDTNPGSLMSVTTPPDIKASYIHAVEDLERRGVFENASGTAAKIVVKRDTQNPARVNVYLPLDRVNPLDVLAANATVYAQFPEAA